MLCIQMRNTDFASVVIINLLVSLLVALFFVPSLIEKIGLEGKRKQKPRLWIKRMGVRFSRLYLRLIGYFCRYRVALCILL